MKFFSVIIILFTGLFFQKIFAIEILTDAQQYPWVFSKDNGETIDGISTDIIKLTMKKSKIDYTITNYPWPRAFMMTERYKETCIYPTALSEQRKNKFKWVGPVGENIFTLFAIKGSKIKLTKLEDAKKYSIAINFSSAIAELLKKKNFTRLHEISENNRILLMLKKNRIDLWAANKAVAINTALNEKIAIEDKIDFGKSDLYLACNKSVSNSIIKKLNDTLNTMQKDGTLSNIQKKYSKM